MPSVQILRSLEIYIQQTNRIAQQYRTNNWYELLMYAFISWTIKISVPSPEQSIKTAFPTSFQPIPRFLHLAIFQF